MKRKTNFVVFSFICLSTMVLAGCSGGTHTHTFVEHEAKSATCTTAGNQKYFTCSAESCKDKIFNENKEETTAQAISIPALGHSYGEAVITWQGAVAHAEATCSRCSVKLEESKTGTFVTDSAGTCVEKEKGHYHVVFDNEHFGSADSGVVEREYGPHHLHKVNGQAETCEAPGFLAHYECDVAGCSKMFADETATDEITDLDAWKAGAGKIAPHPHTVSNVPGKAPSCTEAGYKEAWVCSECDNYFEEEAATTKIGNKAAYDAWVLAGGKLNPTPHDTEKVPGQPETCTADGWKDYYQCKDCKALYEDKAATTPITDLAAWKVNAGKIAKHAHHDATEVPGEAATCTADGFKSAWTCGECGQYFSDSSLAEDKLIGNKAAYDAWVLNEGKIPAHGHDGEKVPGVAHDRCVADGYKDAWKCKYADCGLYFSDSTCDTLIGNNDDYAAWKIDPDGGLDPKAAHTPDGNVVPQVDAVRENEGKKAYQHCSVCECLLDKDGNETTDEALIIPAPAKHFEAATDMNFDFEEPIALTETITLDIKFINPVEGSHINVALFAEKEGGGSDWNNYLGYFEIYQDSVATNNGVSVDTITDDGYLRVTFDLDQIDKVNQVKPAVPTFDAINGLYVRGNWSNVEGYVEVNSKVEAHHKGEVLIPAKDYVRNEPGYQEHYECIGCDDYWFDKNGVLKSKEEMTITGPVSEVLAKGASAVYWDLDGQKSGGNPFGLNAVKAEGKVDICDIQFDMTSAQTDHSEYGIYLYDTWSTYYFLWFYSDGRIEVDGGAQSRGLKQPDDLGITYSKLDDGWTRVTIDFDYLKTQEKYRSDVDKKESFEEINLIGQKNANGNPTYGHIEWFPTCEHKCESRGVLVPGGAQRGFTGFVPKTVNDTFEIDLKFVTATKTRIVLYRDWKDIKKGETSTTLDIKINSDGTIVDQRAGVNVLKVLNSDGSDTGYFRLYINLKDFLYGNKYNDGSYFDVDYINRFCIESYTDGSLYVDYDTNADVVLDPFINFVGKTDANVKIENKAINYVEIQDGSGNYYTDKALSLDVRAEGSGEVKVAIMDDDWHNCGKIKLTFDNGVLTDAIMQGAGCDGKTPDGSAVGNYWPKITANGDGSYNLNIKIAKLPGNGWNAATRVGFFYDGEGVTANGVTSFGLNTLSFSLVDVIS